VASYIIDEDMSVTVARVLREAGHDAIHIREAGMQGAPDALVFLLAKSRNAILVTEDLDFSDIRAYPLGTHSGSVILRIPDNVAYSTRVRRVMEAIEDELHDGLDGCLLIVEAATTRRRNP
jgi:predicted nuclease of predicted toxin-antitoxin system